MTTKTTNLCSTCHKFVHETRAVAIHKALRSSGFAGRPLRVYPCPAGNGWHLTKRVSVA